MAHMSKWWSRRLISRVATGRLRQEIPCNPVGRFHVSSHAREALHLCTKQRVCFVPSRFNIFRAEGEVIVPLLLSLLHPSSTSHLPAALAVAITCIPR
ncbi:hypothetical protein IQ07DRAFT_226729 [Pyrenochaeta sp. DS3sAY3a]|nr:hypothetical protein IQ07DRAFT_226729 [Pyrenochaeta sp. DS3sAY3a]